MVNLAAAAAAQPNQSLQRTRVNVANIQFYFMLIARRTAPAMVVRAAEFGR